MSFSYVIAWLLPLATGVAAYLAFDRARAAGWRCSAAGYGFVFGLLLVSALTALSARVDTAHAWAHAAPWLVAVAMASIALIWLRGKNGSPLTQQFHRWGKGLGEGALSTTTPRWQRIALLVLLASLAFRAAIALREIWLRPTYPWDAWSAWMVKAKSWFGLGYYTPYVAMHDWMAQAPDANWYTGVAQHYPNALAWVEVWFASAAGGWIEPLINLPWLGLWIALLFAHYGQWRALGLSNTRALFFVYVLGSLPLLTVHAALAGYADIWIAVLFAFAVLAWTRWLQQRDVGQLALALVCAAVLPTIKLEGYVWMASLLAAIAFGALPSRWRWRCVILAVAAFLALFVFGGAKALLGLTGHADASGQLALVLAPSWHGEAIVGIGRTLFAQPNWHLLWWLVPPIVIWHRSELAARDWLWLPGLLLAVCIGLLLFLFLATDASRWAQSFTAINRLVLQLTPAVVSLLALLLRDVDFPAAERGTDPTRDPRSDPG